MQRSQKIRFMEDSMFKSHKKIKKIHHVKLIFCYVVKNLHTLVNWSIAEKKLISNNYGKKN